MLKATIGQQSYEVKHT